MTKETHFKEIDTQKSYIRKNALNIRKKIIKKRKMVKIREKTKKNVVGGIEIPIIADVDKSFI